MNTKIKIKIKSLSGKVLFEFKEEENTIKKTLIEALANGADLRCAYLIDANLSGANLIGADLYGVRNIKK